MQISAYLDPKAKGKLDLVADALGVSLGTVIEQFVDQIEVDLEGRPSYYDGPLAEQEVLPLAQ